VRTLPSGRGLHPRSARDFLDALVALGFLERTGDVYANVPAAGRFLDKRKASYIGGILGMANHRLFRFWSDLTPALRTASRRTRSATGIPRPSSPSTPIRHV
jgi:hypothetical protein